MQLHGLHHVTAVTGNVVNNLDFYTRVLGLRLVKKSVNQDDTSAYHLFYSDTKGTPGLDMTFFDWPRTGPDQRGTDSIANTLFRVNGRARRRTTRRPTPTSSRSPCPWPTAQPASSTSTGVAALCWRPSRGPRPLALWERVGERVLARRTRRPSP